MIVPNRPQPRPGDVYRHFKGSLYCIVGMGRDTETQEELVIYQSTELNNDQLWCRSLENFLEILGGQEGEEEGTFFYRFERVETASGEK